MFPESDRASIERRFFDKVVPEPNSGCWLWTGSLNNKGYGEIMLRHTRRARLAHRVSYALFVADPDGSLLHSCDVTCCVNPDHLRLGTQAENMRDSAAKGRGNRGRRFPQKWKLTEDDIAAIKADRRASRVVAAEYGVSHVTVHGVRNGTVFGRSVEKTATIIKGKQ